MNFVLLTHSQEINKPTGTGQLVKTALGSHCRIIEWSRTQPSSYICEQLSPDNTLLIYPVADADSERQANVTWPQTRYQNFVLLDGTWQQSRKIYNRSPYLHRFPHFQLKTTEPSLYSLRRNQVDGGLCTAETVMSLLQQQQCLAQYTALKQAFEAFVGLTPSS